MRVLVLAMTLLACSGGERVRVHDHELVILDGDADFGAIEILQDSVPHKFTVAPAAGLQDDEIEAITSSCADFRLTSTPGLPLPTPQTKGPIVFRHCTEFQGGSYGGGGSEVCVAFVEQTYSFDVTFRPLEIGDYNNCSITVHLKGGSSRSIAVKGTGSAPPQLAVISPAAIDFRGVNRNLPSDKIPITITSAGSAKLTFSAVFDDGGGIFLNDNPAGLQMHTLEAGTSETFGIQCNPDQVADFTGSLTFETDDPSHETVVITFACSGILSAIAFTQTSGDAIPADGRVETKVDQGVLITLTLTTIAASAGVFESISLAVPNGDLTILSSPAANDPLPALGESVAVVIRWTPTTPFDGDLGTLVIGIDNEADPRVIPIALAATAKLALVTSDIVPSEDPVVDFGALCIGPLESKLFRMRGGSNPAEHTGYTITGVTDAAPFVIQQTGTTVGVNPPTEVDFQVDIQVLELGVVESTLAIQTDSPTTPSYPVRLRVEGLLPGPSVSPSELPFQRTVVTGYTNTQTGVFRNCTAGPVDVQQVLLDGASAADFLITRIEPIGLGESGTGVGRSPPFTLGVNEKVEIDIQMLPQTEGVKAARVVIDFQEDGAPEAGSTTIALSGEAFSGLLDRDSYYRCSTGGATAWPLVAVVWLVVRRRRRR